MILKILGIIVALIIVTQNAEAQTFSYEPPGNADMIKAIVNAASKTRVRAALLYGLLGQETAHGRNVGKTEKEWSALCRNRSSGDCEYWKAYDCKENYQNARYYDTILRSLKITDDTGKANRKKVPTSSTCALGFAQFEPKTWMETVRSRGEENKKYNPWNIYDATLIAAYYLEELGADATQAAAPGEVIGPRDHIALKRYYCGSNYWRLECDEYANGVAYKSRRAQEIFLTTDLTKQLALLQKQIPPREVARRRAPATPRIIPPPTIISDTLYDGTTNIPYQGYINVMNGTYPFSWELIDSVLPKGLTFERAGFIQGIPEETGFFTITVRVTDAQTRSATKQLTFTVKEQLVFETKTLPEGKRGLPYEAEIIVTGGIKPYQLELFYGEIPEGLSFKATTTGAIISGTPKKEEYGSITVRVTDKTGTTETQWYNISVMQIPIIISPEKLPTAIVGETYEVALTASDGILPYTWELDPESTMPKGLRLDLEKGQGIIRGIPKEQEYGYIIVKVTDSAGNTGTAWLQLEIVKPLAITKTNLQTGKRGEPYNVYFQAEGGRYGYIWKITKGELPPGLELIQGENESGKIAGIPTTEGKYVFDLLLTDSNGLQTKATMRLVITGQSTKITASREYEQTPTLIERANGEWVMLFTAQSYGGAAYRSVIKATRSYDQGANWTAPVEMSFEGNGKVPLYEDDGTLFAAVRRVGAYKESGIIILRSQDGSLWQILGKVNSIPDVNVEAESFIKTSDGKYYLAYAEMTSPSDIYITRSNDLTNWETPIRVTATGPRETNPSLVEDNDGTLYLAYLRHPDNNIIIEQSKNGREWQNLQTIPVPSYTNTGMKFIKHQGKIVLLHNTYNGIYYNALEGKTLSLTKKLFAITGGSNQTEPLITRSGTLSIAQAAYQENQTDIIVENLGAIDLNDASLENAEISLPSPLTTYSNPPLIINTGNSINSNLTGNGGRGPYTWTLIQGSLPPGVKFNEKLWMITGAPEQAGTYSATFEFADSTGQTARQDMVIEVKQPIAILTKTLLAGTTGESYTTTLRAEGGAPPYRWSAAAPLPNNLTLNEKTGTIEGVPQNAGEYYLYFNVFDTAQGIAYTSLPLSITAVAKIPVPPLTPLLPPPTNLPSSTNPVPAINLPPPTEVNASWNNSSPPSNFYGQIIDFKYAAMLTEYVKEFRIYVKRPMAQNYELAATLKPNDPSVIYTPSGPVYDDSNPWELVSGSTGSWRARHKLRYLQPASAWPMGEYSTYVVAVNNDGNESIASPVARQYALQPLMIISPRGEIASSTPKFEWTVSGGIPNEPQISSVSYDINVFDETLFNTSRDQSRVYQMGLSITPDKPTASDGYSGKALEIGKKYITHIQGSYFLPIPAICQFCGINYISMNSATTTFWISNQTGLAQPSPITTTTPVTETTTSTGTISKTTSTGQTTTTEPIIASSTPVNGTSATSTATSTSSGQATSTNFIEATSTATSTTTSTSAFNILRDIYRLFASVFMVF